MGNWDVELEPNKNRVKTELDTISRQAVLDLAVKIELPDSQTFFCISPEDVEALPPVTPQEPSNDMVSLGVFEQVMWERDVAIDQLKELGYGFGEKPRTGHWIVLSATDMCCSECNEIENLDTSRKFCAYCGTRMSENTTDSENEEQT